MSGEADLGPSPDASSVDEFLPERDQGAQPIDGPHDQGATDLRADPFAPFGQPQPIAELNTSEPEDDPTLSEHMLEIFFDRNGDLWTATRSAVTESWTAPFPVAVLNTASVESSPELSSDGLTLFFSRDTIQQDADIYVTTRVSPQDSWAPPTRVDGLSSSSDEWFSALTADGRHAFITSRRSGTIGEDDIFEASRATTNDPWGALISVPGLNSTVADAGAWCNADGTIVYLDSVRGSGNRDIWVATRGALTDAFDTPLMLEGVNTSADETDPWLSADFKTLYFTRNVAGNLELFVVTR